MDPRVARLGYRDTPDAFTPAAREVLRRKLGRGFSPAILRELEQVARDHARLEDDFAVHELTEEADRKQERRFLQRLAAQLRGIAAFAADYNAVIERRARIRNFAPRIDMLAVRLEDAANSLRTTPRASNALAEDLGQRVLEVLTGHGVKITSSNGGAFGTALRLVWELTGVMPPNDLFPHIRKVIPPRPRRRAVTGPTRDVSRRTTK